MCFTHNPEAQSSLKPHKAVLARDGFFYARIFEPPMGHGFTQIRSMRSALALFGGQVAKDEAAEVVGDFAEASGSEDGVR